MPALVEKISSFFIGKLQEAERAWTERALKQQQETLQKMQALLDSIPARQVVNVNCSARHEEDLDRINLEARTPADVDRIRGRFLPVSKFLRAMSLP